MWSVALALLPAVIAAVWFFGWYAFVIIALTTLLCLLSEFLVLWSRYDMRRALHTALDGSAVVTGILLALNLPPTSPWWLIAVGAVVAMLLGKHLFGGLGQNIFNPALVARVFLLISFPAQMTTWVEPVARTAQLAGVDAVTGATPLGMINTDGLQAYLQYAAKTHQTLLDLFLGNMSGSLGEVSALALLIGAAFLFWRKLITWHIPVSFVAAVFALTGIMWLINREVYAPPLFHVISGGLIIGAFFMATDMVTSPVSPKGMIIFGIGCGLLTALIRLFGSFPEGVSFAILIMNGLTPLIDRYTRPVKFGAVNLKRGAANA